MAEHDLAGLFADNFGVKGKVDLTFALIAQHIGAFAPDHVREDKAKGRRIFGDVGGPTAIVEIAHLVQFIVVVLAELTRGVGVDRTADVHQVQEGQGGRVIVRTRQTD